MQLFLLEIALLTFFQPQQIPSFKVDAQFVRVPVTVLDENGRTVTDLTREDLAIFDEGEPRPIENFILDQTPIHVLLLLDASGSVEEEIEQLKESAFRFAQSFGREDLIAVAAFSDEVILLRDWTNDHRHIRKALNKAKPGYRTALYDALIKVTTGILSEVPGKKVIILLTDGLDNQSRASYEDAMDALIETGTSLYIVSRTKLIQARIGSTERVEFLNKVMKDILNDDTDFVEVFFREKEQIMNHLAETSGGRVFFPDRLETLGETYVQIARELKTQYVLTFLPPASSEARFRKIRVTCSRPVGRIFHREIYRYPESPRVQQSDQ